MLCDDVVVLPTILKLFALFIYYLENLQHDHSNSGCDFFPNASSKIKGSHHEYLVRDSFMTKYGANR